MNKWLIAFGFILNAIITANTSQLAHCQEDTIVYTSLEEALKTPDKVYKLYLPKKKTLT